MVSVSCHWPTVPCRSFFTIRHCIIVNKPSTTSPGFSLSVDSRSQSVTHTHTIVSWLFWTLSGTTQVSWYQKDKKQEDKTNLDLLEQEIVSGSGISWVICKSAPWPRHITTPASHHSVLYRPDTLPVAHPTASKHWRHIYQSVNQKFLKQCK